MRALEFVSSINSDGSLTVPSAVIAQLPTESQPVRVLLLVSDDDEDRDWARLTAQQFFAGYDDADAIYDHLSAG
jgi:hypothetical protein